MIQQAIWELCRIAMTQAAVRVEALNWGLPSSSSKNVGDILYDPHGEICPFVQTLRSTEATT